MAQKSNKGCYEVRATLSPAIELTLLSDGQPGIAILCNSGVQFSLPSARMHSEGYGTWSISVSVSVTTFSATTRNETTKERHKKVQH